MWAGVQLHHKSPWQYTHRGLRRPSEGINQPESNRKRHLRHYSFWAWLNINMAGDNTVRAAGCRPAGGKKKQNMASSTEVIERLMWLWINTCWSTINMQDSSAFKQKSCLCPLTVDLLPLVRADLFHRYSQVQFNAGRSRQKSCPTFPKGSDVCYFPPKGSVLKSANTPAQRCSLSAACRQQGAIKGFVTEWLGL